MSAKVLSEAIIRSNDFTLVMSGLFNLNFKIQSHYVTCGQPWGGISNIKCDNEGCTMTVLAGRKASSETAEWFARAIKPGSAIGCDTHDVMPKELNFAFKGTMSFDYDGKTFKGSDIVIAQGHNARSHNNWWIGGPYMSLVTGFSACASQDFSTGKFFRNVIFKASFDHASRMKMGILEP